MVGTAALAGCLGRIDVSQRTHTSGTAVASGTTLRVMTRNGDGHLSRRGRELQFPFVRA